MEIEKEPKLIQFYRGQIPSKAGLFVDEYFDIYLEDLENNLTFAEILFPVSPIDNTKRYYYPLTKEAIKIIKSDEAIRSKIIEFYEKFYRFYGFIKTEKHGKWYIRGGEKQQLLDGRNNVRLFHLFRFLVDTGFEFEAYEFMLDICNEMKENKKLEDGLKRTIKFWAIALRIEGVEKV